jgi:hypothetical protein
MENIVSMAWMVRKLVRVKDHWDYEDSHIIKKGRSLCSGFTLMNRILSSRIVVLVVPSLSKCDSRSACDCFLEGDQTNSCEALDPSDPIP